MKQVVQDFKSGDLFVSEVSPPALSSGFVLIQNHFSLISAGTERSTVSTAKANLIGKARQRPDLVKQVLDSVKKNGLSETLMRVKTKLATLKELGYSSAGTVLASMDTKGLYKPGDRVACGGGHYASHAGIITVPQNLVVRLPDTVSMEAAAFTTLGSIAMQGVRQAAPRLGDNVCVIGLGLLGQITTQILRANGCRVFGLDTSQAMVQLGRTLSCHTALKRDDSTLQSSLNTFTGGYGFDSVIITAAAKSTDPVELATEILRRKGVIVVVGAVTMNIPREPYFYQKELELKISTSYGPGRYDQSYEEEGLDYPYGYVRWTEGRNMAAFVRLIEDGHINTKALTTHVLDIDEAERAYDIVMGKIAEPYIAILLRYPEIPEPQRAVPAPSASPAGQSVRIGFIGAGSFAQKFLIPSAAKHGELKAVVTSRGVSAKSAAEKFKFAASSTDKSEIINNKDINAVFIATRHDTHADLVVRALQAGKSVFVEKPLAIDEAGLQHIRKAYTGQPASRLMVGFNRRFAPLALDAKNHFSGISEPLCINYRVNAGFIPKTHWSQTAAGGGRILGEVCHFVDMLQFLTGSHPIRVFAESISADNDLMPNYDNIAVTIRFANGSLGAISYLACGDKALAKERIEIFGGQRSFIIDDFTIGSAYRNGSSRVNKKRGKGHDQEVDLFCKSVKEGLPSPIDFESILYTTITTFRILDSLSTAIYQDISLTPLIDEDKNISDKALKEKDE